MYRLVAYAPDGVRRFPIHRDELILGSEDDCDIRLPYTGVSHHHARLTRQGDALFIEDLGSRRGMLVSGKRVKESGLEVLDEIRLGGVTLLVEDVAPEGPAVTASPAPVPQEIQVTSEMLTEQLCRISDWVLADPESRTTLESLAGRMLEDFGGGVLVLFQGEGEQSGVKFITASNASWLGSAEDLYEQVRARDFSSEGFLGRFGVGEAWISCNRYRALERPYFLIAAFPRFEPGDWSPAASLRTIGNLLILGLVHHVGHYEPILPGKQGPQNLTLEPGLVVGESRVMQEMVDQLKTAVDQPVQVLLRGASGVGKELIARSLHLSSPRRHGPFITASCGGISDAQVEADLFGAEVEGRDAPVRRQGKIQLADGGTLFLQDVEQLPLKLQARLVRFLRSGEVEPAGSLETQTVDVRLIASTRDPLEALVARDLFRVDLAYRLSQVAIDVPSLRERREDLPLLIQRHLNRFCHESGKRVHGITVKAMGDLLNYDYPGNLPELENITRQAVHLCPAGQPIDRSLLPERVRTSRIRAAARVDQSTDLNLERLLADCERAAIREALRRSGGNKSQAARALGLSRNGLSMKMQRHGVTT
jgi:DNA-binding NtrC family response regulator/pSer/pThr/pTyr-binding forkhead associated (FHA) protein